jgi:hypothetical protein
MAAGGDQAALQAAAQAVLQRNAHIVLTLDGACAPAGCAHTACVAAHSRSFRRRV